MAESKDDGSGCVTLPTISQNVSDVSFLVPPLATHMCTNTIITDTSFLPHSLALLLISLITSLSNGMHIMQIVEMISHNIVYSLMHL